MRFSTLWAAAAATSLLLVLPLAPASAQGIATNVAAPLDRPETKPSGLKYSLSTQASLAYSGVNAGVTAEVQRGRHALYAGPKLSLADSYLPSKGPFGGIGGYKFYFLPDYNCVGRFGFFANLDYQLQRYRAFDRDGGRTGRHNSLHELSIGYGLEYRLSNRWRINNVFGFGRYWEIYQNATRAQEYRQTGYNRLVRLQVLYTIN